MPVRLFQATVDYLTGEGIPRDEAEQNLAFVLVAMSPPPMPT